MYTFFKLNLILILTVQKVIREMVTEHSIAKYQSGLNNLRTRGVMDAL